MLVQAEEAVTNNQVVSIIGAGLAGCEAAWQAARLGVKVRLYEMRPAKTTPAHKTGLFAELVCSNSLRSNSIENAAGLLKRELVLCGSLIMQAAEAAGLPAGGALAVDRLKFAAHVTDALSKEENITVIRKEVVNLTGFAMPLIIATGPLTSDGLATAVQELCSEALARRPVSSESPACAIPTSLFYFYDAAAPVLQRESLDMNKTFLASRYDKGGADYINCPLDKEEYLAFRRELVNAGLADIHDFEEKKQYFEGCLPIEEMARRSEDTMRFGPLKPVGLIDPRTGREPYAVVQLRQDDAAASAYNMVGFQTQLKWSEQRRVFAMIPGLERAEFLRYGVMHRNSFINSPRLLDSCFAFKGRPGTFFAGQITGVEGYIESTASGLMAGRNAAMAARGGIPAAFPRETAMGALANYISDERINNFQPMNINFGLFPPLTQRLHGKKNKKPLLAERALTVLTNFLADRPARI